ncbi:class I SAM-dependent methyltransferase [Amorphus sp. MBR-141]
MLDIAPHSAGNRFRARRFALFRALLDEVLAGLPAGETCRVLDIGGTAGYWDAFGADLPWERLSVTLTNLTAQDTQGSPVRSVVGDARSMPEFADGSFHIVHSNSVIEHVGRWRDMKAMAGEVRRLARAYFVQTPYFWFPIEPHARTPFVQFLPEPLRYRLFMTRRNGFYAKATDVSHAMDMIQDANLLDRSQMRALFPDADIRAERAFGLIKSLIAIRRP